MKVKSKSTTTKTAYGKTIPELPYSWEWNAYENIDEVKAANNLLSDAEVVKTRNRERMAKARAASLTAALSAAGYEKPTIDTDEQLRLKEMFKILMSSKKYTKEQAREVAATNLGLEWDDEDEDTE